jgi:hypothetical protein
LDKDEGLCHPTLFSQAILDDIFVGRKRFNQFEIPLLGQGVAKNDCSETRFLLCGRGKVNELSRGTRSDPKGRFERFGRISIRRGRRRRKDRRAWTRHDD